MKWASHKLSGGSVSNDLIEFVYEQRDQFARVLSDASLNFEREASFAVQHLMANDFLLNTAIKNKDSVRNAVANVAAIGVSLNPASKLAYLVPRKGVVCLDISYMGLMHIAQQSGAISWGQARIVYAQDHFELQGIDKPPIHNCNPFDKSRKEMVGVYVVVKTGEGDYLTHTMAIDDVWSIRDRSESYKSGKSSPWKTDTAEMVKKTCVKQAAKYWPRRDRLDTAVHHLDTDGGEGLASNPDGLTEEDVQSWKGMIQATTKVDAAKEVWKRACAACTEANDKASYDILKKVTIDHCKFIDSADKVAA